MFQTKDEKKVLIKFMKTKVNCTIEGNIDFISTIYYLPLIEHPNFMKFFGWTEWRNEKVIVMEIMHISLQSGKTAFNIFFFKFATNAATGSQHLG